MQQKVYPALMGTECVNHRLSKWRKTSISELMITALPLYLKKCAANYILLRQPIV